ncbi:hydrocephalus-inducing protein-like [Geothlypis trichas]
MKKKASTGMSFLPRIGPCVDLRQTGPKLPSVPPKQNLVQISPPEVVFQHFDPHGVSEMALSLTNVGKVPQEVKVSMESSPYFQLSCSSDVSRLVPPGASAPVRIRFTPGENKDYSHELVCVTENERIVVPIRAIGARAVLDLPARLDLSKCPVRCSTQQTLLVRNVGDQAARYQLSTQSPFSVVPATGILDAGDTVQVTVAFHPLTKGDHCSLLSCSTGEENIHTNLHGEAVEVNAGLSTNLVEFDETFITTSNHRTLFIENRSNITVHFQWKAFPTEEEEIKEKRRQRRFLWMERELCLEKLKEERAAGKEKGSGEDRAALLRLQGEMAKVHQDPMLFSDDIFLIEPLEGAIGPNCWAEIKVTFKPLEDLEYLSVAYCSISGHESRLPLRLSGEGQGPLIEFSSPRLDLGNISIDNSYVYEVELLNLGAIDAAFTYIPSAANVGFCFKFAPEQGIIAAGGSQTIQMFFSATVAGRFQEEFQFSVAGSPMSAMLGVRGCVTGPSSHFEVNELDFGDISPGSTYTEASSLSNTSPVSRASLWGEAHSPNLQIQPSTLEFGCLLGGTGEEEKRSLEMANCSSLPVQHHRSVCSSSQGNRLRCEPYPSKFQPQPPKGKRPSLDSSASLRRRFRIRNVEEPPTALRESWDFAQSPGAEVPAQTPEHPQLPAGLAGISSSLDAAHTPLEAEKAFSTVPQSGVLQPGQGQQVSFSFSGPQDTMAGARALCRVQGGPSYEVELIASRASYSLSLQEINCGLQMFNEVGHSRISLENTGRSEFSWVLSPRPADQHLPGVFLVKPSTGFLAPGQKQVLKFSYLPALPGAFSRIYQLQVGDLEPENICLRGEATCPMISVNLPWNIRENENDEKPLKQPMQQYKQRNKLQVVQKRTQSLRSETLMSQSLKTQTPETQISETWNLKTQDLQPCLLGSGIAPNTQLQINMLRMLIEKAALELQEKLTSQPQKCRFPAKRLCQSLVKVELPEYVLDMGPVLKGFTESSTLEITNPGQIPVFFQVDVSALQDTGFSVDLGLMQCLPPGRSVAFDVRFESAQQPQGAVDVLLPIEVIKGPTSHIRLRATVLEVSLELSKKTLQFSDTLVGQCQVETIRLYNWFQVPCTWFITASKPVLENKNVGQKQQALEDEPCPFEVTPCQGTLDPGRWQDLQIQFTPEEERFYKNELKFNICGSSNYLKLQLSGQGLEARLEFSPPALKMGRVLVGSDGVEATVVVKNPCTFPIEFYCLDFDEQNLEEEKLQEHLGLHPQGPPLPRTAVLSTFECPEERLGPAGRVEPFTIVAPGAAAMGDNLAKAPDVRGSSAKGQPRMGKAARRDSSSKENQISTQGTENPQDSSTTRSKSVLESASVPKEFLRLKRHRWMVPAQGEVELKVHFSTRKPGRFEQTLRFELVQTKRRYELPCSGTGLCPSISQSPRYKAQNCPGNSENLTILNNCPGDVEGQFCFESAGEAEPFLLEPPSTSLKPKEKQVSDTENTLGIVQAENIKISAEVCDVSLSIDVPEAVRVNHIEFGHCPVGEPCWRALTISSHAQTKVMRFEWEADAPFRFSPKVGHLHPGCAKDITVTLRSDVPATFRRHLVKCKVTTINLELPQGNVQDWDDQMTITMWKNTTRNDRAARWPKIERVLKAVPEPAHAVLEESSQEVEVYLSAVVAHAQFQLSTTRVQFQDTLPFQTRTATFTMHNTGEVALKYSWEKGEESEPIKKPFPTALMPRFLSYNPEKQHRKLLCLFWREQDHPAERPPKVRQLQRPDEQQQDSGKQLEQDSEQQEEQEEQPEQQQEEQPEQQDRSKKLRCSQQKNLSPKRVSSSLRAFPDVLHDLFSINPCRGTIAPGHKQTFQLHFSPKHTGKFETTLLCRIPNLEPAQNMGKVIVEGRVQEWKNLGEP